VRRYYEQSGITIYHGDCREILPPVSHVITDVPYARDVYRRVGAPPEGESFAPARLGGAHRERRKRLGIPNHQYSSLSIEKLAAGAIGFIDAMLDEVASEIARLTQRWGFVFSDLESCNGWRGQDEPEG